MLFICSGHVESLGNVVTSQYADGLFTQQPNSKGQIYNVSSLVPLRPIPSFSACNIEKLRMDLGMKL